MGEGDGDGGWEGGDGGEVGILVAVPNAVEFGAPERSSGTQFRNARFWKTVDNRVRNAVCPDALVG